MKKFLIALLAALLVVSMATVAFAVTATGTSGETDTSGADKGSEQSSTAGSKTEVQCDGVHHYNYEVINVGETCENEAMTIYRCICGAEIREGGAKKKEATHKWDEAKTKVIVKGDCLTPGSAEKTCLKCGKTVTVTTAGAHDWTEYTTVTAATCIKDGMKKRQCLVCGLVDAEKIGATGKHTFTYKYVKEKADCKNYGTYEAQCDTCGKYFWYVDLGDGDVAAKKDGTIALKIPARGHKMGPAVVKKPTCKEDGYATSTCQNIEPTAEYKACTATETVIYLASTQAYNPAVQEVTLKYHDLEWKEEVPATKTAKAIGYYQCKTCGWKSKEVVKYSGDANAIATTASANASNTTSTSTKPAAKPASSSTNKKGVSIPKTNDTTSNLPYVLIAVAFVGLVALVASKKKVNG